MTGLIDFSSTTELVNNYTGNDDKIRIRYNSELYLLKLGKALKPIENEEIQRIRASYAHSAEAEYLGSHIFAMIGVPTQNTILGTYQNRAAVACKDFIAEANLSNPGRFELIPFANLESSFLDSSSRAGRTPLFDDVMNVLEKHKWLEPIREEAIRRFWEMFIGDALIGNFDRHSGNWGYINDLQENRLIACAPVYDCGSSFYPALNETGIHECLMDTRKLRYRIENFPAAALMVDGKKIKFDDFLMSERGYECRTVLLDLYPKIDVERINDFIEQTPLKSPEKREFCKQCITQRHHLILEPAYQLALSENQVRSVSRSKATKQPSHEHRQSKETQQKGFDFDDVISRARNTARTTGVSSQNRNLRR